MCSQCCMLAILRQALDALSRDASSHDRSRRAWVRREKLGFGLDHPCAGELSLVRFLPAPLATPQSGNCGLALLAGCVMKVSQLMTGGSAAGKRGIEAPG